VEPKGTALVTGASRGIGRAVAQELAQRGFDTIATMRNVDDGAGLDACTVQRLDVNDPATYALPNGLKVLVNNAGVESENLPLELMGADAWRSLFETNVFGLVSVTKAAIPVLRDAGGGVICNVTTSSLLMPVPFLGAYRASKAAVSAICESLRTEVAPFGIRVVEIMPGPIETDMLLMSERPSLAIDDEHYHDLAARMWDARKSVRDNYTPATEAARRIVDAICDDDGPMRVGCDDMSEGMLSAWRGAESDEAWMRSTGRVFNP
jgi:NAD(P)-dependent dehydrogenase (short-subunit alcohol dehydrogenase family)